MSGRYYPAHLLVRECVDRLAATLATTSNGRKRVALRVAIDRLAKLADAMVAETRRELSKKTRQRRQLPLISPASSGGDWPTPHQLVALRRKRRRRLLIKRVSRWLGAETWTARR